MAGLIKKLFKGKSEPKKEKEKEAVAAKPKVQGAKKKKTKSPVKQQPAKLASAKRLAKAYSILKEPHITEKAAMLGSDNQYVFRVYPKANKIEVKKAVESVYGVTVTKVRMAHIAPKKRRVGRREGWRHGLKKGYKKAIVTLKQGDKIENF